MVDPKARSGERVDPVAFEQTADNQSKQEVGKVSRLYRVVMEPKRHRAGAPVDDHTDQHEQGDTAQFGHAELSQSATILRR